MNEEYGNASFIRPTEAPDRAIRGSGPKKARYTGLSIASLRENIRMGKLDAKIAKYNKEYEELWKLAKEVNSDRQDLEEGKVGFADVSESIERYNRQAKKLAAIGVQVLAFDTDIRKINLAVDSQVKAIRVPGFLIGPLRMLTAAGREKARAEKEAAAFKEGIERRMYDAIVSTAQDAIGQKPEDTVSKDGMLSLRAEELATTVKTDLGIIEPKVEPVVEPPVSNGEEEKAAEPVTPPAKADDEKKKAVMAGAMGAAYKKKTDAKKKNAGVANAVSAIKENDLFAVVSRVNTDFGLTLVEREGKRAEMLYARGPEKNVLLTPDKFAKIAGITGKAESLAAYKDFIAIARVARLWNVNAAKEVVHYNDAGEVVDVTAMEASEVAMLRKKHVGAFEEDRKALFDFVATNVEAGLSEEELIAKAATELNETEAAIVTKVVSGHYEVLEKGLRGLKSFMVEEPAKEREVEPVAQEEQDSITKKKTVVGTKITELGMKKYGKKPEEVVVEKKVEEPVVVTPAVEEPVVEEPTIETPTEEEKIEEKVVSATPDVKAAEGSYVDQINRLVDDIAALSKARDGLREALGDEASEQLESLEKAISDKLAQINKLALGGIVTLGKDGEKTEEKVTEPVEEEKKEEEQPVVETPAVEEPVMEEPVVEAEEKQEVTEDPEIKAVVEKAVLDENGAHITININLGTVYNKGGNFAINIGDGLNVQVIGGNAEVEIENAAEPVKEEKKEEEQPAVEAPVAEEPAIEEEKKEEPVVPEVVNANETQVVVPSVEEEKKEEEQPVVENPVVEDPVVVTQDAQVEIPVVEESTEEEKTEAEETDLEHRDAIMWWNEMVPFLDKPQWERDLAAERADRKIEDIHFEERKAERIAEDKAARAARAEENKEKRARSMLAAYGMSDEALDAMEQGAEAGEMTPYQFLEKLKSDDVDTYNHIVTNYIEVKRAELSELSANLKAEGKLPDTENSIDATSAVRR